MNGKQVRIEDRRAFLEWLIASHRFKSASALSVLRFFLFPEERLARLRLIEDCSYLRPLLVVSTYGLRQPGLLYQTFSGSTTDDETILFELSFTEGPVYFAPFFPGRHRERLFLSAREEGGEAAAAIFARIGTGLETASTPRGSGTLKRRAIMFLIDQALERRDRKAFYLLTGELKKLTGGGTLACPDGEKAGSKG
ncbi:MAG: IDEAL domain-containing protein [Firmicutes bacterium]|nr:IDEAL domain-containing protein [Bacillota bacterium]